MPLATRRYWVALAVLVLPCFLVSMDSHVLNLAVPAIVADLRPSGAQLLWIVDGYVFLVAGSLLAMGAVGDRVGRRRLLLVGVALFSVASLAAAFATTAAELIAARLAMGLAGASLMLSTLALIRGMFATAGAVGETSAELGGALGIALLGSLGVAVSGGTLSPGPAFEPAYVAIAGAACLTLLAALAAVLSVLAVEARRRPSAATG